MADVDQNVTHERTGITFSPPAGVGTLLYPGTPEDAQKAIERALSQRSWLVIPSVDGAPPIRLAPYALRHVAMVCTIIFDAAAQEQPSQNGNGTSPIHLPFAGAGVSD